MSNFIKHKKSGVAGKKPQLSDLDAAELLFNYKDGVFYGKKISGGIETVVEFHGSETHHLFKNLALPSSPLTGYTMLYPKADSNFYILNSFGVESQILSTIDRRSDVRPDGRTDNSLVTETGIRAAINSGYDHTHPYQPLDSDLTVIAALSGYGVLRRDTFSGFYLDTSTYLTGTKVDSFNHRTGAVTLTKSDVEEVLTGDISSHTHLSYDYYNHWKLYVDSSFMAPIMSAYQLNIISGSGIRVTGNALNKTLTFENLSPFPGFGTAAGTAAEGNHSHTEYASSLHTHSVSSLSDTTISSPATGELLMYSSSRWINRTLAEAGIAAASHTHSYDNYGSWTFQTAGQSFNVGSGSWLNLSAGSGIDITWDAVNHKATFSASGGGGSNTTTVVSTFTSNAYTSSSVAVPNLSVDLEGGKTYEFEAVLNIGVSSYGGGTMYGINYPGTGTVTYGIMGTGTTSNTISWRMTSLTNLVGGFLTEASTTGVVILKGIIRPTSSSNLTIKHQKSVSGTSYVYGNSYLKVTQI